MDGPVFDTLLKTALEEALRREIAETPELPAPSRRQRRRMRKLLTNPQGGSSGTEERRLRFPARWLAAAVVAALLTGVAAGAVFGGGTWFRRSFDESEYAKEYGAAANTEQLLEMGVTIDTPLMESNGLRFEMLDAVFDGRKVLATARVTVLDKTLLEQLRAGTDAIGFDGMEVLLEEDAGGWSSSRRLAEEAEGQFTLTVTASGNSLSKGGQVGFRMKDLVLQEENEKETLWPGEWTLSVTLPPTEALRLEPNWACRIEREDWLLESIDLSPLSLRIYLRRPGREIGEVPNAFPYEDLAFHMKDGAVIERSGCTYSAVIDSRRIDMRLEFPMPLDLEQVEYIHICGGDFYLEE